MKASVQRVAAAHLAGFGFDRDFYRTKAQKDPTIVHEINVDGTDVETFWMPHDVASLGGLGAGFVGKGQNSVFYYSYRDKSGFDKTVSDLVAQRKLWIKRKMEERQKRKEYRHDYAVGDILYSSWGYDQTNVDFYEVTAVSGKQVLLREIASRVARSERGADYVVAVPGRFSGPSLKRLVGQGGSVRISDVQRAYKWDGKPKYQTAWGYGH